MSARRSPHRPSRRTEGDVHVGTMGADVRLVPGSTTPTGAASITRQMRRVLDEVRRDVRNESKGRR